MAEGTEIQLTEREFRKIAKAVGDEGLGINQVFVMTGEKEQTITVGRLGTDNTLDLTKREAEVLATIILDQIQKW